MSEGSGELCPACNRVREWSPRINLLLLEVPGLARPYRLWSNDEYRICMHEKCDDLLLFIRGAIESHAQAAEIVGERWRRALLLFDNLEGLIAKKVGKQIEVARA